MEPGLVFTVEVVLEVLDHRRVGGHELLAAQQCLPMIGMNVDQQLDRVPVVTPGGRIDLTEETSGGAVPRPPEVVGVRSLVRDHGQRAAVPLWPTELCTLLRESGPLWELTYVLLMLLPERLS